MIVAPMEERPDAERKLRLARAAVPRCIAASDKAGRRLGWEDAEC
jgi:hypothetical protein